MNIYGSVVPGCWLAVGTRKFAVIINTYVILILSLYLKILIHESDCDMAEIIHEQANVFHELIKSESEISCHKLYILC